MVEPKSPHDIETPADLFELAAELYKTDWVGIDTCWMKPVAANQYVTFSITNPYIKVARVAETVQEAAAILYDCHPDWEIPLPPGLDEALGPNVTVDTDPLSDGPETVQEIFDKPEEKTELPSVEKDDDSDYNPTLGKPRFHG